MGKEHSRKVWVNVVIRGVTRGSNIKITILQSSIASLYVRIKNKNNWIHGCMKVIHTHAASGFRAGGAESFTGAGPSYCG